VSLFFLRSARSRSSTWVVVDEGVGEQGGRAGQGEAYGQAQGDRGPACGGGGRGRAGRPARRGRRAAAPARRPPADVERLRPRLAAATHRGQEVLAERERRLLLLLAGLGGRQRVEVEAEGAHLAAELLAGLGPEGVEAGRGRRAAGTVRGLVFSGRGDAPPVRPPARAHAPAREGHAPPAPHGGANTQPGIPRARTSRPSARRAGCRCRGASRSPSRAPWSPRCRRAPGSGRRARSGAGPDHAPRRSGQSRSCAPCGRRRGRSACWPARQTRPAARRTRRSRTAPGGGGERRREGGGGWASGERARGGQCRRTAPRAASPGPRAPRRAAAGRRCCRRRPAARRPPLARRPPPARRPVASPPAAATNSRSLCRCRDPCRPRRRRALTGAPRRLLALTARRDSAEARTTTADLRAARARVSGAAGAPGAAPARGAAPMVHRAPRGGAPDRRLPPHVTWRAPLQCGRGGGRRNQRPSAGLRAEAGQARRGTRQISLPRARPHRRGWWRSPTRSCACGRIA
jgi:hypothetical protein